MPLLINEITTYLAWAWLFIIILFLLIGFCVWLQSVGNENNFDLSEESLDLFEQGHCCGRCDGVHDLCIYDMEPEDREAQMNHLSKYMKEEHYKIVNKRKNV